MIRLSATAASLAALAMASTPAAALELPPSAPLASSVAAEGQMEAHGWGYRRGYDDYRYGRRHRDRGGIGAGEVIAGVLVIGAIAAIASSSSKRSRETYDERYPRRAPARADYRGGDRNSDSGIDRAVDMCVDQVERGSAQVDNVDNAARGPDGWRVSGQLADGEGWQCWIGNDGRVRSIDFGNGYSGSGYANNGYASAAADGQLSDEAYARARAATRYSEAGAGYSRAGAGYAQPDGGYVDSGEIDADLNSGPMPAYPGGPLPGEEGYSR